METPRSSMAPARTGSYHTAHAGLLLHVRQQIENGEPQFGVHLAPHVGDVSGPAYWGFSRHTCKNDSQVRISPIASVS